MRKGSSNEIRTEEIADRFPTWKIVDTEHISGGRGLYESLLSNGFQCKNITPDHLRIRKPVGKIELVAVSLEDFGIDSRSSYYETFTDLLQAAKVSELECVNASVGALLLLQHPDLFSTHQEFVLSEPREHISGDPAGDDSHFFFKVGKEKPSVFNFFRSKPYLKLSTFESKAIFAKKL